MQLVVWPGSNTSLQVGGDAAGCWDVSVLSTGATPRGVILQVRNANPGYAISAVAPAVVGVTQVAVELVGLRLVGAACKYDTVGTTVTIPVNSTGATAVVWCAEQATSWQHPLDAHYIELAMSEKAEKVKQVPQ